MQFKTHQTVFFVSSGRTIRRATIVKSDSEFSIIRFENGGGIRVRNTKLYPTKELAEQAGGRGTKKVHVAERNDDTSDFLGNQYNEKRYK